MEDLLNQLLGQHLVIQIGFWVGLAMGLANTITASFPSIKKNPYYNFVMKVLNFVAGNIGKNKNADAVK